MSESTIYSFTGTAASGADPESGVTPDAAGDLFGTTFEGGPYGNNYGSTYGTVYEIKAGTTTETILHKFTAGEDGAYPQAGVTLDAAGDIFGTTTVGGSSRDGTVYEILAGTTTLTTLHSFDGTDGANPSADVTLDSSGDIFGTTQSGGANGDGTVYEIKAGTGTATTLHSFGGADGANPFAGVTLDAGGDLFGTTVNGGLHRDGTVYEILAGTTTAITLHSFGGADGADPYGGVTLNAVGDIFGTTDAGGSDNAGTVYVIKAGTNVPATLYSFNYPGDGGFPAQGVTLDTSGDIFGATAEGGSGGYGTVYEIKAGTTTPITLHSFTGTGNDGVNPQAGVTLDAAGDLFGTTQLGGSDDAGTIFEVANAVCYYPGTSIRTPSGDVLVEKLMIGECVMTSDGRSMPIRWIGRNTVSTRFADPLRVLPIRIRAGALAEGLPERDLLVSPEHAVLVEDILIQAGALVNGLSVARERDVPETFVYYHVELAEHALIVAEGTPAESFVDNIHRMAFDNWAEHEALYGFAPITEMPYPRALSYRQVPAEIHDRLMERAQMLFGEASQQVA